VRQDACAVLENAFGMSGVCGGRNQRTIKRAACNKSLQQSPAVQAETRNTDP
jgi:hypothetical protein